MGSPNRDISSRIIDSNAIRGAYKLARTPLIFCMEIFILFRIFCSSHETCNKSFGKLKFEPKRKHSIRRKDQITQKTKWIFE